MGWAAGRMHSARDAITSRLYPSVLYFSEKSTPHSGSLLLMRRPPSHPKEETKEALRKCKRGKAVDIDGVAIEHILALPEELVMDILHRQ